jgi:hypothetical protein
MFCCFGWPSDDPSKWIRSGWSSNDLLDKDSHHRTSFSAITSIWLPFVFGFKSSSVIHHSWPTDYAAHGLSHLPVPLASVDQPDLACFFCTFSREFGGGLLLKWGFLIILHFHCLVPVLIFPIPLIQTYDAVALVDQVTALLNGFVPVD